MLGLGVLAALAGCATIAPTPQLPPWTPHIPAPPVAHPTPGAIYTQADAQGLFSDTSAYEPGDILTIVLQESTQGTKKASTTTAKKDNSTIGNLSIFGHSLPKSGGNLAGLSSNRAFNGSGSSDQSDTLTGQITVIVTQRLPNGDLVVQGSKWLTINQGNELIRIEGIVRPEDIGPDNTVLSPRVADARIAYTGEGTLADADTKGWLSRFFSSKWMPF